MEYPEIKLMRKIAERTWAKDPEYEPVFTQDDIESIIESVTYGNNCGFDVVRMKQGIFGIYHILNQCGNHFCCASYSKHSVEMEFETICRQYNLGEKSMKVCA